MTEEAHRTNRSDQMHKDIGCVTVHRMGEKVMYIGLTNEKNHDKKDFKGSRCTCTSSAPLSMQVLSHVRLFLATPMPKLQTNPKV